MSLSAWEQQALNSIQEGLAGSDPELAALLSAFNRMASDAGMPDRKMHVGSRRALRRLRRARWHARLRRACQRLGCRPPALLLWLLTVAALIGVIELAVSFGGGPATCPREVVTICTGPAPGHSTGPSGSTSTSRAPRLRAAVIPHAGP